MSREFLKSFLDFLNEQKNSGMGKEDLKKILNQKGLKGEIVNRALDFTYEEDKKQNDNKFQALNTNT